MNLNKRKIKNKNRNDKEGNRAKSAKRLFFVSSCICVAFTIFTIRLVYIMIYKNDEYSKMAEAQRESQNIILADRGDILARNGAVLASTIGVYRVDLDLKSIRSDPEEKNLTIKQVAKLLSDALEMDFNEVLNILESKNDDGTQASSAILIRGIEKSQADKVKALDIYGVIVGEDTKRFYPGNNYLSHALGSVRLDNKGLNGIELQYDRYLAGIEGLRISEVDGAYDELPSNSRIITPPIPGKDVTLTIDENIQYIVENIAEKARNENIAKSVSIIVSNPKNGEILAMTNKPDFNPNNTFEEYEFFPGENSTEKLQNMFRDSLVSDTFEPGSTFKNFTMMAAIEEGVVSENDTFTCNGGTRFGDTLIKCWNIGGHGTQTLPQILQNSCNVGFMEIGERLGTEKMNEYLQKYGFGQATNIDLPGESEGILKQSEDISEMDLATIAFGQTNTATALQLITAFNAIANGGDLIQPHIMKEISHIDEDGTKIIDEEFKPKVTKGIMSEGNTAVLRDYLERTINQGGAIGSFMGPDYRIGAKTGTAEKADTVNGGYQGGKYIASVLAMYPVDNPQITIYIKVDEPNPEKYYGGEVTNPITKEFFKEVRTYIESPVYKRTTEYANKTIVPDIRGKSIDEATKILKDNKLQVKLEGKESIITKMNPNPGSVVQENSKVSIYSGDKDNIESEILMPNLIGLTLKEIDEILNKIKVTYNASGTGRVIKQNIVEGQVIDKKTKIQLELE
ncbi:MAG: stage V sporulation protein D [Clostridium sp.]